MQYLQSQWPALVRYLDDGRYPIDNNTIENAFRPLAIGRKNWLFSKTQAGARASANLYSLIETAKGHGIEPYAYLRQAFKELPLAETVDDIDALLPHAIRGGDFKALTQDKRRQYSECVTRKFHGLAPGRGRNCTRFHRVTSDCSLIRRFAFSG